MFGRPAIISLVMAVSAVSASAREYRFETLGVICSSRAVAQQIETFGEIVQPVPSACRVVNPGQVVPVLSMSREGRLVSGETGTPPKAPEYFVTFEKIQAPEGTPRTVPETGAFACVSDEAAKQFILRTAKGNSAELLDKQCWYLTRGLVFTSFNPRRIDGVWASSGWAEKVRNGATFTVVVLDDIGRSEPGKGPSPTAPEVFVAPAKGVLACPDSDDLIEFISLMAAGKSPGKLRDKCWIVPAGTKITVRGLRSQPGFKAGEGFSPSIRGGQSFAFLAVEDDQPAAKSSARPAESADAFKVVSPRDVLNAPEKWLGRPIEFKNVNVYWVGDDDVRFVTETMLTVFASNVRGKDADFLRENCETEREIRMAKCKVNIRFRYDRHSEDKPNGYLARTVIQTTDIEVSRAGGRQSRGR